MEQSLSRTKKILIPVFSLLIIFSCFYFIFNKIKDVSTIVQDNCLNLEKKVVLNKETTPATIELHAGDKIKIIGNIPPNQSSVYKLKDCSLYVITYKGFDYKTYKVLENFNYSIWAYPFFKDPYLVVNLANRQDNKTNIFYQYKFDVSDSEQYISLVQGYLGSEDYALHIKDIETKQNVVEVNLTADLFKKYPNVAGDVEFRGWSSDEKYFWFSLFDQANVLAFVKVDMSDSSYEVFDAPVGTMNQDAFNIETGWVTYDDGPPWTGVKEFDDEYQQEWEDAGDFVTFSLYNIFSKQKIDLEKTTDTTWWHYPKWLDNETLEYKIPSGETKTYKI